MTAGNPSTITHSVGAGGTSPKTARSGGTMMSPRSTGWARRTGSPAMKGEMSAIGHRVVRWSPLAHSPGRPRR